VVQRFGRALNLNVHLHALVLDGVFTHADGVVRFHPVARLTSADVMARIARRDDADAKRADVDEDAPCATGARAGGYRWAELMRRTFGADVLACLRCGGRLRLVALIEQASVIQHILRHLGLPTEVPEPCPARAPPRLLETNDDHDQRAPDVDAVW